MFELGFDELLLIAVVAIVVIGPKDLPLALRTVGRWVGKVRRVSGHFRAGIDTMIREAELEEMERKWREQNDAIMKAYPDVPSSERDMPPPPAAAMPEREPAAQERKAEAERAEPQLPLPPP